MPERVEVRAGHVTRFEGLLEAGQVGAHTLTGGRGLGLLARTAPRVEQ